MPKGFQERLGRLVDLWINVISQLRDIDFASQRQSSKIPDE